MVQKEQRELRIIKQSNLANYQQQRMMDDSYKEAKALLDIYEENKRLNTGSRKHRL